MKTWMRGYISVVNIVLFMLVTFLSQFQDLLGHEDVSNLLEERPIFWTLIKIFKDEEFIPGVGMRTTVLFSADKQVIKAYCLDPYMPIPPVGTVCKLDITGIFQCGGILQRFRPVPIPTATPTPTPLSCKDLGLGLHVVYGKSPNSIKSASGMIALVTHTREFQLDPLAISPDEIWNKNPIHMVTPNVTCGTFTVFGIRSDLPPEVTDIEVTIDCPGIHRDLSSQAADGRYCFNCNDIHFTSQKCVVTNKVYITSGEQKQICQAFYLVIDP